jgi:hypothetical protein
MSGIFGVTPRNLANYFPPTLLVAFASILKIAAKFGVGG